MTYLYERDGNYEVVQDKIVLSTVDVNDCTHTRTHILILHRTAVYLITYLPLQICEHLCT